MTRLIWAIRSSLILVIIAGLITIVDAGLWRYEYHIAQKRHLTCKYRGLKHGEFMTWKREKMVFCPTASARHDFRNGYEFGEGFIAFCKARRWGC